MTNAWERAKQMAERHATSIFTRLANDGDKVVGVFLGEPYAREVVWTGEKYLDAESPAAEPYLKKGRTASLRVAMNLYVPAERALKVYEMGTVVFQNLLKLREKYGLDAWAFEIQRHGGKGDSKTSYTLLPEQRVDDEMRAEIAKHVLHDLEHLGRGGDAEEGEFDSYEALDAEVLKQMMPRLKALPREVLDQFLATFGVQRVKEIRKTDADEALKLLAELEAPQQPAQEIDPFV